MAVVAALAVLLSGAWTASATAAPKVVIKGKADRLQPGKKVRVKVTGFASRDRVRFQFGLESDPPANCCASKPFPGVKKPGIRLNRSGAINRRIKMPKRYAQCVGVHCASPNNKPYRNGDSVYLLVYTDSVGRSAKVTGKVAARKGGKKRRSLSVAPKKLKQGEDLRFAGTGWPARAKVGLRIGVPRSESYKVGQVRTNRRGRFTKTIGPIRALPGKYVAMACIPAAACKKKASDRFRVVRPRGHAHAQDALYPEFPN